MRVNPPWYVRARTATAEEWLLFLEAFGEVMLANARVRRGALPSLQAISRRPLRDTTLDGVQQRELIGLITWAIARAAKRSPFRAMCFERGLAAKRMLNRRGIPSVLYYGVAYEEQGAIDAHVWVIADGLDVCGASQAPRYKVLAQFPEPANER